MAQAIVLATDSRFSFQQTGKPAFDTGTKVHVLGPRSAFVFSGDVLTAQRIAADTKKYLDRLIRDGTKIDLDAAFKAYSGIAMRAYSRVTEWKRKQRPPVDVWSLELLLGHRDDRGEAWLVKMTSAGSFRPLMIPGVHIIGDERIRGSVLPKLLEIEQERWKSNRLPVNPDAWVIDVVAAMRYAIESPARPATVGGKIQCVLIGAQGLREMRVSWTAGDPMDPRQWNQATVDLRDTRRVRREGSRNEITPPLP